MKIDNKVIYKMIFAVCTVSLLAGCSSAELASSVAKRHQGYYKVGSPYEVSGETYTPEENSSYDETGIASWYGPGFHGGMTANGEKYDSSDLTAAHRTLPLPSLVRVTNIENGKSVVVRVNDRGPFARGRIIDVSHKAAELLGFIGSGTAKVRVQLMDKESKTIQAAAKKGVIIANLDELDQVQSQTVITSQGSETIMPPSPIEPITAEELPPAVSQVQVAVVNEKQALAKTGLDQNLVGSFDKTGRFQPAPSIRQLPAHPNNRVYIQAGAFANRTNADRLEQKLAAFGNVHVTEVDKAGKVLYRVRVGPAESVSDADTLLNRVIKAGADGARIVVDY